jgi:lipoic acid synthetase
MPDSTPTDKPRRRLPDWLKKRLPAGGQAKAVRRILGELKLATVCSSAHCPNLGECFARRTATFMILGDRCTRNCRFCAVPTGDVPPVRPEEPEAVAEAAARLGLRHVVITSVTRDDLPDGGAEHFAATIRAVRAQLPRAVIEVLTPDFQGDREAIETVIRAAPAVFNHNVETVPSLYDAVRGQADYRQSLDVLRAAGQIAAQIGVQTHTKSGLMVGCGETREQILRTMHDLREVGCEILTVGQYLAPSANHLPVDRYVEPAEFAQLERLGREMGFAAVAAGPFVRSSYQAEEVFRDAET